MAALHQCLPLTTPHSGGVMHKCGMTYEGTQRRAAWTTSGIASPKGVAIHDFPSQ